MFVNFAKEQTDEDHLTDVVVSNANSQFNATPQATTASSPATQPQSAPDTPPQQPVKPSDSKEGKSKKSKSGKVKSKNGKSRADKSSGTAMTTLPQEEKVEQGDSSSSNSSNLKDQGEASTNKNRMEDTCKHPSTLFIVNSDTQDSSLWGELVQQKMFKILCFAACVGTDVNTQP